MKKLFLGIFLILLVIVPFNSAQPGQSSCTNIASQVYAGSTYAQSINRSISIQNQSTTVSVYLDRLSTLTPSTAGILLAPGQGVFLENKMEAVYCITSGSSATVGITIFY